MGLNKYKLGELIQLEDTRNSNGKYLLNDVKGISIQKVFIETKADMEGVSLFPYIVVKPDFFAYVTVTSRNGEKITLAHNDTDKTFIVSSSYVVFSISKKETLNSDYLFMYFNRPEFDRRVFSGKWRYRWSSSTNRVGYTLDFINVDYVSMPWISDTFKRDYLDSKDNRNAILRYNYENLLIMKLGFSFNYNDGIHYLKVSMESAGNLLKALSKPLKFKTNDMGQYEFLKVAYAQYAKADVDYTYNYRIDERNTLALHSRIGIAMPYGNSTILPYEKRYFSGGANSVRGWSVRELGPGCYHGKDGRIDFINQTGDLRLDLNAELRSSLFWKFQGAIFIDAGNIWTVRQYADQPGGLFTLSSLYKEIAVAYGVGLRLNFDYFILRLDLGMKAISPYYTTTEEHYPISNPNFKRDYALHFAVGLPF